MRKNRFRLQEIEIHFGTFDFTAYCVIGPRASASRYVAWKLDTPGFVIDDSRGQVHLRRGYTPIIWLPRPPRTAEQLATLAHEMLHVVQHMLGGWAAMPLTDESQEAYCHALGHGIRTVLGALRL